MMATTKPYENEENTIYALVKTSEYARVFDRAIDDDVAAEAIYMGELRKRLGPYGIEVVEVEMPDNPTGSLAEALAKTGLGGGS